MNIDKEGFFVDEKGERIEPYKLIPAELGEIMALMRRDPLNSIPEDAVLWMRIYFESNPAEWPQEYLQALECKQVEHNAGRDRLPQSLSFMQMLWEAKCFVRDRCRQLIQEILKCHHINASVTKANAYLSSNIISFDLTLKPGETIERIVDIKECIIIGIGIKNICIFERKPKENIIQLEISLLRD